MRERKNMIQENVAVRAGALALAIGFSLSFSVAARAFEVTEAQREACTPDAFRLCSAEIPDGDRVAACMQANVANLSAPCRAVFQTAQPVADVTRVPRHRVRRITTSYDQAPRHHRYYAREEERRRKWARD
jgi:hypothetical protein